jgi:hypothetical protein
LSCSARLEVMKKMTSWWVLSGHNTESLTVGRYGLPVWRVSRSLYVDDLL